MPRRPRRRSLARLAAALLPLLLFAVRPAAAQQPHPRINPDLLDQPWSARWISHPTADRTAFGVFHFRRSFDLDAAPSSFVVHVSADNRYRLYVNGEAVGHGPARGDLDHWRFETYDLAPHLKAGRNAVAAVVWNYADRRPMAQHTYQTAFLLQGDTPREAVVDTDDRWKVVENAAYAPVPVDRAALQTFIVVGPGERVEASAYPWGWEAAGYDDSRWHAALPVHDPVFQEWGRNYGHYLGWQLTPRRIPMMETTPQRFARVRRAHGADVHAGFLDATAPLVIPPHTHATILVDQDVLTTAYPVLVTSQGAGSTVTLTYAEALFDDDGRKGHRDVVEGKEILGYRDVIRPDGGAERRFESLWWRTYRYVELDVRTARQPLVLHDFHGLFTAYPFEERATFTGSDDALEPIWDVAWRTARLCAGETYFDCPYYEQLQYVGDTRIQALISLYVAGDDRLARKAIETLDDSRMPSGLTQSRYPSHEAQLIPPFSLYWVAMVHDYWMHRDDPAFVGRFLTGIRGVVDWYEDKIDETGMLGPTPWWNFVDWSFPAAGVPPPGPQTAHSSILTLQFAYTLDRAAALADAFARADEARHYRTLSASLREAAVRHCWDDARGLMADTPARRHFSEHASVWAVLTDAVPTGDPAALMQRLLAADDLTPSTYYFRFYFDRAMKEAGLADTYVDRLGPWREMLDRGLTTFAEQPDPTRSDSHAWSSSPMYHFLETVLGVEPAAPGFAAVRIAPALGRLTSAEGTVPHPNGDIAVRFERSGDALTGSVTLPEGLDGTLVWRGREIPLHPGTQDVDL